MLGLAGLTCRKGKKDQRREEVDERTIGQGGNDGTERGRAEGGPSRSKQRQQETEKEDRTEKDKGGGRIKKKGRKTNNAKE